MHYCKFKRHIEGKVAGVVSNSGKDIVVPSQNTLICADVIDYTKLKVYEMKEFERLMDERQNDSFEIIGNFTIPQRKPLEGYTDEESMPYDEFIEFRYVYKGERKIVIAPNCELFVMSETGKTLDTLRCQVK